MSRTGHVTLVGAGPGDPGLLTIAGRRALAEAEVVLYDRLVGAEILALIPDDAERIDVGKNKGHHPTPQPEINRLILDHALRGKRVVRLKGGDPYLFGRGAEELELLNENDVPFRVVPGITSAIAVPAYAGIPVTHRNFASSLHIVTGHGKDNRPPDIPFEHLARLKGTLVFLMGLGTLSEIRDGLLAAGMPGDTPAAVVENGTRPEQRRLVSTLAAVADDAARGGFSPPSVLVVGGVCALAESFDWLSRLPLHGRAALCVSSQSTSSRLAAKLRALGCGVDELPCIAMHPLPHPEEMWRRLPEYRWLVLTSRYGAELFFEELRRREIDLRVLAGARFAVVGPGTADVLRSRGVFPDFVPSEFNAAGLAAGLAGIVRPGEKALLFRARAANRDLDGTLREKGVAFDAVDAYETTPRDDAADDFLGRLRDGAYDAVTFTSASAVNSFAALMAGLDFSRLRAVCIGDMTADAARAHGMTVETAARSTLDGMAEYLLEKMGN